MIIKLKVVPRSKKVECILDAADQLKCYIKSPPEKGKANEELIAFFSKKLGMAKQDVQIIAGHASRKKKIFINIDATFDQLLLRLGIEKQNALFK